MNVLDKITNKIVEVTLVSNNGTIYHLINQDGFIYRRFSDEVVELKLNKEEK